jgi:hypothetical protein
MGSNSTAVKFYQLYLVVYEDPAPECLALLGRLGDDFDPKTLVIGE